MQTLYFEESWDKTLATVDREKIIAHFHTIRDLETVHFSFLWQATNHKNELLVTVIVHNPSLTPLVINQTAIASISPDGTRQTNLFDLPFQIPAKTSMPWTFIFSDQKNTQQTPHFTIKLAH